MRVLHLSSERSWRGGEQQMSYLIAESRRRGMRTWVACRAGSRFAEHCRREGVPHVELPFRHAFDLRTALGIKGMCAAHGIELVHVHSGKSHGIAVLAAELGNAPPIILSRRVDFPVRRNRLTRWKWNHRRVEKIICVSAAIERIVRAGVRRPERCVTVHSGVNPARCRPPVGYLRKRFDLAPDVPLVGNTSALAEHKDYPTFVETAARVLRERPDVRFCIVGEGAERAAIETRVREQGLADRVLLTGFLDNVPEVLPELDVFLITSRTEGLGTSVLDAFACRVPVVATAAGGIPEMVTHERTGLLAPVGNADALSDAVLRLLDDVDLRTDLVERAERRLRASFTHEATARRTLDVYREVLGHDA
ncbi:MAG: glycosyltransferase family 4 protein [Catalinimonas sp.]